MDREDGALRIEIGREGREAYHGGERVTHVSSNPRGTVMLLQLPV